MSLLLDVEYAAMRSEIEFKLIVAIILVLFRSCFIDDGAFCHFLVRAMIRKLRTFPY